MRRASIISLAAGAALVAAGCGDKLHDYRECVEIEKARCALRASCDQAFDLGTCYEYYGEFCRTRKIDGPLGADATEAQVDECVAAIAEYPCDLLDQKVDETDAIPECEFLWPDDYEDTDSDTDTEADAG